mmetsp:Transcript_38075/g.91377  ORF Transcript_38075/g.91377 Transcript_38075/m.91377 type:complete len:677 (-) Transcript_38075:135-2165(-)
MPAGVRLEEIKDVCRDIFHYYATTAGSSLKAQKHMKSFKFQKMALDAEMIDDKLTSTRVDLVFKKVVGSSGKMGENEFRDAIVLLAQAKYGGECGKATAVRYLYEDHLASFTNPHEDYFDSADSEWLLVAEASLIALHKLYVAYFSPEVSAHYSQRSASLESQSQRSFLQVLSDFEITPHLVPKPAAFSAFREAVKASVPAAVVTKLKTDQPGLHLTFPRFILALLLVSRRLFAESADADASKFARFLHRMDGAKQRGIANDKPLGGLRLLPAELSEYIQRVEDKSVDRNEVAAGHPRPADSSRSTGSGRDPRVTLSAERQKLVQQIFCYYASLGDPLNIAYISTLKFNRFLRDCGLLSAEAAGPVSFRIDRPQTGHTPKPVVVNGRGTRASVPLSVSPSRSRSQTRKTPADGQENVDANATLPLKIFQEPPLQQVDADLIFVQATTDNSRGGAPRSKRHHMDLECFGRAVQQLAVRTMGASTIQRSQDDFCDVVLVPLSRSLLQVRGQDVSAAAVLLAEPEMVELFMQAAPGLEFTFDAYAEKGSSGLKALTSAGFCKFCADFDITTEIAHLPLAKIFQDCVHVEFASGYSSSRTDMSFISFQLALVLVALKAITFGSEIEKCVALLKRMNGSVGANRLQAGRQGAFFPIGRWEPPAVEVQESSGWGGLIASWDG